MKTSAKNIVANFVSKVWGFLSLYLFSRFFLNLAGADQFGVISYYTLIFGIVSFVDVGISATITREYAKHAADDYLRGLLRFFEKFYIPICLAGGLLICFFAKPITSFWLISSKIPTAYLVHYICLIGIAVATQLMSTIYFGALMGRQLQVWANGAQIIFNILKVVGCTVLLYLYPYSLYLFFIWQIICNVVYAALLRHKVFTSLDTLHHNSFTGLSKEMWHYMGSMTLVAILSSIGIQSDKLAASKFLQTTDFGFYSLASTLSQLPVMVVMPIAAAIFPVFVKNFSIGNHTKLNQVYATVFFGVAVLIFPLCAVIAFYGEDIFRIWLSAKNVNSAPKDIQYLILFLALGNTFQAMQFMPFNYLMAKGKTKFTIYQTAAEVLFIFPALFYFIQLYGLIGIGIPWFIVKFIGFFYLVYVTHKNLDNNSYHFQYGKIIMMPAVTALFVAGLFYLLYQQMPQTTIGVIIIMAMTMFAAIGLSILFYDKSLLKISKLKDQLKQE